MKTEYKVLGPDDVLLGESPVWDSEKNRVRYLDILGKKSIILSLDSGESCFEPLNEETGSLALLENGEVLYAATSGIFDEKGAMVAPFPEGRGIRFNDGKATADGRFLVGSIEKGGNGAVFRLEKGNLYPVIENTKISNGLDFSLDEKTLYFCDTATRKISAYGYPEIKYIKTIIDFNEIDGFKGSPDGLCIDCEGNLWVAIWAGGCVVCIETESGEIIDRIDLPAKYISCPAFVGENLDILFATSAKNDDESPFAGKCFAVNVDKRGREPYRVKNTHTRKEV